MAATTLTKGFHGAMQRTTLLPIRYGVSPERIRARLLAMVALLERWEAIPTIPVTAVALDRHPRIASALSGADLAIHGYRHVAYANLSPTEQAADLDAARAVFLRHGLRAEGFRAPYLRSNEATKQLLRTRDFAFDSSTPRFLLPRRHPASGSAWDLAATRYGRVATNPQVLTSEARPVSLHVALPDDEILIDAMGLKTPSGLWNVYESMLEAVAREGSLLVLQVHPERFHLCTDALEMLLQRATDQGAWKASLSQVAEWKMRGENGPGHWPRGSLFAVAITGDLDAVSLPDFAWRSFGR